jgi:hypothetical protein
MNVLDRIVDDTRDEVARRRERVPLARWRKRSPSAREPALPRRRSRVPASR